MRKMIRRNLPAVVAVVARVGGVGDTVVAVVAGGSDVVVDVVDEDEIVAVLVVLVVPAS